MELGQGKAQTLFTKRALYSTALLISSAIQGVKIRIELNILTMNIPKQFI
jgi:hypothetical protein